MCGILAVLRRRAQRETPDGGELHRLLTTACELLPERIEGNLEVGLGHCAEKLGAIATSLQGVPGLVCLLANPQLVEDLKTLLDDAESRVEKIEQDLDGSENELPLEALEAVNSSLVQVKDLLWSIRRDRLRNAEAVKDLAGEGAGTAAIEAFASIQTALSAIDRLEVRGRDSAGINILITNHGLDLSSPEIVEILQDRGRDPLFTSQAVTTPGDHLSFIYKAAAEIGELGDNVRKLRSTIRRDPLLQAALANDEAEAVVLSHTRWASVGIISESNAHPLDSSEAGEATDKPFVVAALNGDVDNHETLREQENLQIAEEITTDAKVIPVLISRRLGRGDTPEDAFRSTVSSFVGSVAVAASAADHPEQLLLALHGSGQALYVGMAEDAYVIASEPYGIVEETSRYLRMDGETPGNPQNPGASRGQILCLDRRHAGDLTGIHRIAYDGTPLPVTDDDLQTAEITTRDIDRGKFRHFLLKEISEAPLSFQKTLRGKIREEHGKPQIELGYESLPESVRLRISDGSFHHVLVIGQGTAAVAGQGVAAAMAEALAGTSLRVIATPATELSGFGMLEDMSGYLVIAISQSGTTTDTNRTVDLVRARGAAVISIVNRRNSDLTDKSDGVLYTSDGRDVEMSVASTKAFYSQIAAGFLLALAIARETGEGDQAFAAKLLESMRSLPAAMTKILEHVDVIRAVARDHAPQRRYWAIVGNGKNRVAAEEVRIKLSELCYKSIACDATEDKKHIDLSSEPLILVCAAGLKGSTADDVAKEVAIYRAHKAAPITIVTEGEEGRFTASIANLTVPAVHPSLAFILSTMVGHLFGYEAALAIDNLALPLREMRSAIEELVSSGTTEDPMLVLSSSIKTAADSLFAGLAKHDYDGHLEASTAIELVTALRYVLGITPLDSWAAENDEPGSPGIVIEAFNDALTHAIEELTRPVDAIKHQAKTVTVGISRADEALLTIPLVKQLLATGAPRELISYSELKSLAALDSAVSKVIGHTRYRIDGPVEDEATIHIISSSGIAASMSSRVEANPELRGTKHRVAVEREILAAIGASDHREFIMVPEVQGNQTVGLTLMHVEFHDFISADAMRSVLDGYRNRYITLRGMVMETEADFDISLLGKLPVTDLLTESMVVLAQRWSGHQDLAQ